MRTSSGSSAEASWKFGNECKRLASLLLAVLLSFAMSCSTAAPKTEGEPIVELLDVTEASEWKSQYLAITDVEFVCDERSCGSVVTERSCLVGLAQLAAEAGGDALVAMEVTVQGSGHAGAEIHHVVCKGVAVKKR